MAYPPYIKENSVGSDEFGYKTGNPSSSSTLFL